MSGPPEAAAAVIIGNEVLNAKVLDANGPLLIASLRARGIPLRSVEIVPDDVDLIVEAVARARKRARWIFTSGGIGPTHDDVTVRSVAMALGRRVIRLPEMVEVLARHHPAGATEATLRLADAPEGAHLIPQEGFIFPALAVDGIYMLPGVPSLFKIQLESILSTLPSFPLHQHALFVTLRETEFALRLDAVARAFPSVEIGSYPVFDRALDHRVRLTFECRERAPLQAAVQRLREELPDGCIVREDPQAAPADA